jgi:CBS domain containing-hemolysin-like protein
MVMVTEAAIGGPSHTAELITPLVLAPVVLIYGELLPKSLFLQAPNRLLRRGGPLMLACVVLFFPVSAVLWWLNRLLARVVGKGSEPIRSRLARRELERVLEEGHEAGILYPAQRSLAQGIFAVANQPVSRFVAPLDRVPRARADMIKQDVLRLAQRYRIAVVPVEPPGAKGQLIGYLRVVDLRLSTTGELGPLRPLMEIPETASHLAALVQLQTAKEGLARVVDAAGQTVGIVTADRLREPLLPGGR